MTACGVEITGPAPLTVMHPGAIVRQGDGTGTGD